MPMLKSANLVLLFSGFSMISIDKGVLTCPFPLACLFNSEPVTSMLVRIYPLSLQIRIDELETLKVVGILIPSDTLRTTH